MCLLMWRRKTDKTIKLWKVYEKAVKVVSECNVMNGHTAPAQLPSSAKQLRLPVLTHHDNIIAAVPRRIYANAHAYHINSISVNSDGETYISADDLRVNLWNLNVSDQSFSMHPRLPSLFSWPRLCTTHEPWQLIDIFLARSHRHC